MLVLSRKAGQELVIDGKIRITVNRIQGNRVTLGISAPNSVRIVRGELEPVVHAFDAEELEESLEEPPAPGVVGWDAVSHIELTDLVRQA